MQGMLFLYQIKPLQLALIKLYMVWFFVNVIENQNQNSITLTRLSYEPPSYGVIFL